MTTTKLMPVLLAAASIALAAPVHADQDSYLSAASTALEAHGLTLKSGVDQDRANRLLLQLGSEACAGMKEGMDDDEIVPQLRSGAGHGLNSDQAKALIVAARVELC